MARCGVTPAAYSKSSAKMSWSEMVSVSVAVSFAGFGSTTPELTEAVSERGVVREGSTWTVNAMLAEAPFAREPSEHVTVPGSSMGAVRPG